MTWTTKNSCVNSKNSSTKLTYSNFKQFNFENISVDLSVSENPYNLNIDNFIKIARRINPKRDYLFVSKVIGKHIPMLPLTLKISGALLARKWLQDKYNMTFDDIDILSSALDQVSNISDNVCYSISSSASQETSLCFPYSEALNTALNKRFTLERKTLFMGFAETATGLAHSFFSNFANCTLVNSTRLHFEDVPYSFSFTEPHSHAVDHTIYALTDNLFEDFSDIVIIDDEITTGVTAKNLLNCLPKRNFSVVSLLDWREDKNNSICSPEGEHLPIDVTYSSLFKGNIVKSIAPTYEDQGELETDPSINLAISHDISIESLPIIKGYTSYSGRFAISSEFNSVAEDHLKGIGNELQSLRVGGNTLCIGDEELIYIPCLIASAMGDRVFFQSTTRSPIFTLNRAEYGILNKKQLKSKDLYGINTYIYNLPKDFYEDVFYFTEKALSDDYKNRLTNLFSNLRVKRINFVTLAKED